MVHLKAGTEFKESLENLTAEEFIDYVFLTAYRRATDKLPVLSRR